eukprot:121631_1
MTFMAVSSIVFAHVFINIGLGITRVIHYQITRSPLQDTVMLLLCNNPRIYQMIPMQYPVDKCMNISLDDEYATCTVQVSVAVHHVIHLLLAGCTIANVPGNDTQSLVYYALLLGSINA